MILLAAASLERADNGCTGELSDAAQRSAAVIFALDGAVPLRQRSDAAAAQSEAFNRRRCRRRICLHLGLFIAAQGFMVPMAILCGARADVWGRKILFFAAFAILPIRGVLYTLWTIHISGRRAVLDSLANGIFGMIFLLILRDVAQGTGRFNVAQGTLTMLIGVGASLSDLIAGWIVQIAGYSAGFLFLAGVAIVGAAISGS